MKPTQRSTTSRCSQLALVAMFSILGACSNSPKTTPDTSSINGGAPGSPPPHAYQTFDVVWSTVDERHFDPDHNGVDWQRVREQYRPKIEDTRSEADVRMVLRRMLGELEQSHFVIFQESTSDDDIDTIESDASDNDDIQLTKTDAAENPAASSGPGTSGLRLGWVQGNAMVLAVQPGSVACEGGVKPGWQVATMRGRDPKERFASILKAAEETNSNMATAQAQMVLDQSAQGMTGQSYAFEFIDLEGADQAMELVMDAPEGTPVKFGNLPEMTTEFESYWLDAKKLEEMGLTIDQDNPPRIGYIRFNVWMFPIMMPVAEAVDEFRDAEGIIIDLRGNPGGVGGLAMGVAGHFIDDEASLGAMKMRDSELTFVVNPQRATMDGRIVEPFSGPLAILVDPGTASTSEVFGAGVQQLGRARVFGRNSMGAALPAHTAKLPNGDVFMYAVANFIGPAGESLEGTGVVPDEHVVLTQDRLADEKDPDLKAATTWILKHQSHEH